MGLKEKRAIHEAETNWIPKRQEEINGLCEGTIPLEFDWESFDGDVKGIEWLEHNGPHQVGCAIRVICKDELGKAAVRDGVKKVVFHNVGDGASKELTFNDGVLDLRCAFAEGAKGRFADKVIRKLLLDAL